MLNTLLAAKIRFFADLSEIIICSFFTRDFSGLYYYWQYPSSYTSSISEDLKR